MSERFSAHLHLEIEAASSAEVFRLLARFMEAAALEGATYVSTSVQPAEAVEEE